MVSAIIPYVDLTGTPAPPATDSAYITGTFVAHGLLAADVGKPVRLTATSIQIWDDAADSIYLTGLLKAVVSANSVTIVLPGATIEFATALLESTDVSTNGRWFYWDYSAGLYKCYAPTDAVHQMAIIEVLTIGGTNSTAIFNPTKAV